MENMRAIVFKDVLERLAAYVEPGSKPGSKIVDMDALLLDVVIVAKHAGDLDRLLETITTNWEMVRTKADLS